MTDITAQEGPAGPTDADSSDPRADSAVPSPPRRRKRHVVMAGGKRAGRAGLMLVFTLAVMATLAGLAVLSLTGRPLNLPVWAVAEVETRANEALREAVPGAALSVGAIEVTLEEDWTPRLRLEDLRLLQADGATLLALPDLRLAFDAGDFLRNRVLRPQSLRVIGGSVALKRQIDGTLDLSFGTAGAAPPIKGLAGLLAGVDRALATSLLSRLERIEAEAASLTLEDARTGRVWTVGDGRIRLENRPDALAAEMSLTLVGGGETPAQALVTLIRPKGQTLVRLTATVDRVASGDIAAQAPVLGWLGVVDAPISGRIASEITEDGIAALEAEISLGAGALRPEGTARPIMFDRAAMKLGYDPAAGRITLGDLSVESSTLRLKASGQSYPLDATGQILTGALGARLPSAFLGQVAITEAQIDPEGLFERPLVFTAGAMDARLTLRPFRLDIGQITLIEEKGRRLSLAGRAVVQPEGWQLALDLGLDSIAHDRLLQLWPKTAVANTREWVGRNVAKGVLTDVKAALRVMPGQEPRLSLGYEFDGAEVRFLRTLPPIHDGRGRSSMEGKTYMIVLDSGTVDAPLGGEIDVAGSVFSVPDITEKPARAEIRLRSESSVTAALSLLDLPPFGFMAKAGRTPEMGQGRAVVDTRLSLPLARRVELKDVHYSVDGQLIALRSDVLVPGKTITADALTLKADPAGLTISGPGRIGRVPFDVVFAQGFGAEAKGRSSVTGQVELSPATVAEFGLGLPDGMVSGTGSAKVAIQLQKDAPGRLSLTSDLSGIGLRIDPIGWSKPAARSGNLSVEATLGQPPQIEKLSLDAAGLKATGTIDLRNGGGLERAAFSRVTVDGWLDAPVALVGRGGGRAPDIVVSGGSVDLRRFDPPASAARGGGGAESGTLKLSLDELTVTEGIRLTGFRGDFAQRGGLNGAFRASVNGAAPVTGEVVPSRNGTAVRIRSDDAGAVLKAAGVFASARGGALDLQLTPQAAKGRYDGTAMIRNFRVKGANVLAELLSAVSVVGLLEQLNGDGIAFSEATADVILIPQAIEVTRASATGASLGVSMAGLYGTQTKRLALQGVISPVYLINGIGAALTRRGEGVFGFNYSLRGTADDPQVQVNPLSILTPGMFREIFRRPAPVLEKKTP